MVVAGGQDQRTAFRRTVTAGNGGPFKLSSSLAATDQSYGFFTNLIWEDISPLAVLTGLNGSGRNFKKSLVLLPPLLSCRCQT